MYFQTFAALKLIVRVLKDRRHCYGCTRRPVGRKSHIILDFHGQSVWEPILVSESTVVLPGHIGLCIWLRFCQIRYFFQKESAHRHAPAPDTAMFHGLWFMHGCKTILQEVSHSQALYLLKSCNNNLVSSIFMKANVTFLRPGDEEVRDNGSHDANDFHCA